MIDGFFTYKLSSCIVHKPFKTSNFEVNIRRGGIYLVAEVEKDVRKPS